MNLIHNTTPKFNIFGELYSWLGKNTRFSFTLLKAKENSEQDQNYFKCT